MIHPNWVTILFLSFVSVLLCNALIASFTSVYYKNMPIGKLNHSQLRIKQGNATLEHRLNVFVLAFLFGITSFRNLFLTIILAVGLNFAYLALA